MVRELDNPVIHKTHKHAIIEAITIADEYGYGNVMAWVATAWAVKMRDEDGVSEALAIAVVSNRMPYPLPKRHPV